MSSSCLCMYYSLINKININFRTTSFFKTHAHQQFCEHSHHSCMEKLFSKYQSSLKHVNLHFRIRVCSQVFLVLYVGLGESLNPQTLWHTTAATFTTAPNLSMPLLESFLRCIKSGTILCITKFNHPTPNTGKVCCTA